MHPYIIARNQFNKIINRITLARNQIPYNSTMTINGRIYICSNGGKISFGKGVVINSGHRYNPIGGNAVCSFVTRKDAAILIGDNVGISNTCFYAFNRITVEENVMIGGSCCIYDSDFHSLNNNFRTLHGTDPDISVKPVMIKKGAFIGGHCIILKGVTIGENSVIGAGSVVTKSVPPNEIWAGNPARYIKSIDS